MLTKKDLLTYGIEVPKTEEKIEMALPPEINNGSKKRKRDKRLFSGPVFKENLKANRVGLTVVSIGNALIMVVIVCILSTLNINATSNAMKEMFGNADYESTIKSSSISLYSAYTNSAEAYLTIHESEDMLDTSMSQALAAPDDTELTNQIKTAKLAYDTAYTIASGTEEEKNATAKNTTMSLVTKVLEADTSRTLEEKQMAEKTISYYFDIYANDKSKAIKDILIQALPLTMTDVLGEKLSLTDDKKTQVSSTIHTAFDRVYTNSETIATVSFETALDLLPLLAPEEQSGFITPMIDKIKVKYQEDKEKFVSDKSIGNKIVSEEIQKFVFESVHDFAYWQYLPDFTVPVKTSDRGYPIHYVGTGRYAPNGNEIMKEQEIFIYNPSLYVPVKGDMGPVSNLVEKMHKDVITGVGYTEEEISVAKEKAEQDLSLLSENLKAFMDDFIIVDNTGKNAYYDGEDIIDDAIESRVTDYMVEMASKVIIDNYNDSNKVKVSSLEEITSENSSMSGQEMLLTLKGYVNSGIASYKSYLQSCREKGYSEADCLLVASVKGSTGVIDQLPGYVADSLSDLGDMNTYGIMVGLIGFAIACLLIPMVYTILLSNNLVANKVETGSLAFTLSTPIRRISFVFTQGIYLLFSEVVMFVTLLIASVIAQSVGVALGGTDFLTSLPIRDICLYAFGNFMVTVAISSIAFFASCFFNKSMMAIACGGGISIFFYICIILGMFGTQAMPGTIRIEAMNFFNYITIFSLFDPMTVMNCDYLSYSIKLGVLLLISMVFYIIGTWKFTKKDLPL